MLAPGSAEAKEYAAKIKKMRCAHQGQRQEEGGRYEATRSGRQAQRKEGQGGAHGKEEGKGGRCEKEGGQERKRHALLRPRKAKKTKARAPASSESSDDSSSDDEPISAVSFKKKLRCTTMELLKKANMDELSVKALVRQVAKSMGKSKSEMKVHKAFIKEMAVNFCTSGA